VAPSWMLSCCGGACSWDPLGATVTESRWCPMVFGCGGLPVENARLWRQFLIPTHRAGRFAGIVEHHAVHALDFSDNSGSRSASSSR